jgi:hypothetical protein
MGTTTREINTLLQRHGLFPDKHAVTLLKQHVDQAADAKGDIASIIARIKGNPARGCHPQSIAQRDAHGLSALAVEECARGRPHLVLVDWSSAPRSEHILTLGSAMLQWSKTRCRRR